MTVQECYIQMQGDYADVLKRLKTDERIIKFLEMFLQDKNYEELEKSVKLKAYSEVFKHSHDLKGMGLNLGLTGLYNTADVLCNAVRGGEVTADILPLFDNVSREYHKTVELICNLINE